MVIIMKFTTFMLSTVWLLSSLAEPEFINGTMKRKKRNWNKTLRWKWWNQFSKLICANVDVRRGWTLNLQVEVCSTESFHSYNKWKHWQEEEEEEEQDWDGEVRNKAQYILCEHWHCHLTELPFNCH